MTANLNLQMQNDRRSGHLLQVFVKWLVGQRPSFSSACRPSCHSLLRLPLSRRTWRCRQAAPTAVRPDSCDLLNAAALFFGSLESGLRRLNGVELVSVGTVTLNAAARAGELKSRSAAIYRDVFSIHIFLSFLSGASLPLRWLKHIPTAWVMQHKSSTIFGREIANKIEPLNS